MTQLEKDISFTVELIAFKGSGEMVLQGIEYYLTMLNHEDLTKEQEQSLVDAIRGNPAIRTPEQYQRYSHFYNPTTDKAFLSSSTWKPDSKTLDVQHD